MTDRTRTPKATLAPVLGAATVFIIYQVLWNLLIPPIRFIGGAMVANTIPLLLAAAIATTLGMAIFEPDGRGDFGIRWREGSGRNAVIGVLLGGGGACLLIAPAVAAGLASWERVPNADVSIGGALFLPFLLFCGAAGEEILFRGFMLQYMIKGYGPWTGIISVGALFGALHANNPGASALGVANTAGFGILFGYAVWRTHNLWLGIGMHLGWNVLLPLLGADLSGLTIRVTGYRLVWHSSGLWSGGSYGPEASLAASAVLIVLFVVLWKAPVAKTHAYLLDPAPVES